MASRIGELVTPLGTRLAARVGLATGMVVVGDLFALQLLGDVELKGFGSKVRAWRVLGDSAHRGRFEAHVGGRLAPMMGREQEQALLIQRWAEASAGEGQVFLLLGEAGIGKSRLIRALRDEIAGQLHSEIHLQCSPFHEDTPLWPLLQAFDSSAEQKLAEAGIDPAEGLPLLGPLLGVGGERQEATP